MPLLLHVVFLQQTGLFVTLCRRSCNASAGVVLPTVLRRRLRQVQGRALPCRVLMARSRKDDGTLMGGRLCYRAMWEKLFRPYLLNCHGWDTLGPAEPNTRGARD